VPLDGSAFSGMRGYMGESRGRFEGDTLVVETRNFNGKAGFRGSSGENLRLTERYTRVAPDTIDFRLTIEDETQWTAPWTVAYLMRPAEGELYEYACHEGNYGLRNILENEDGTTTAWMIEGATPNTLFRRGFTRDAVKIGTEITIEGYR